MDAGAVIADRYVVDGHADTGGMGAVFRAHDDSGRPVALKLLRPDMAHLHTRFVREAQLLQQLHHPAIVRCLDSGETASGEAFLVMEWLDGQDLRTRLAAGRCSMADALCLTARIASALDYAHRRGVIHRDVKPSNIFLPGGDVTAAVLLDFGIARWAGSPREAAARGEDARAGTPAYMSPEQVRGHGDISAATDIFALGCVLFECLTGEPAFVAHDPMAVYCKILMDEPPRAGELVDGLPEPVEGLLGRMLATDAERRPSSRQLRNQLAELTERLGDADLEYTPESDPTRRSLTTSEQRMVHVVMARTGVRPFDPGDEPTVWTRSREQQERAAHAAKRRSRPASLTDQLSAFHHLDPAVIVQVEALTEQLHTMGARFGVLGDGSLIAVMESRARPAPKASLRSLLAGRPGFAIDWRDSPAASPSSNNPYSRESSRLSSAERDNGAVTTERPNPVPLTADIGYATAIDHVVDAARCALRLHQVFPHAEIALASGRAVLEQQRLIGAVIDSAAALLPAPRPVIDDSHLARPATTIRVDSLTAALLGARFEIAGDPHDGFSLHGERQALSAQRLLGRSTRFVGRAGELDQLGIAFDRCATDKRACAVLLTGLPGFGKSRLCEEFLQVVESRDDEPEIWLAQGDTTRGGTSLHLMADALRNSAGIADSEPDKLRWRKLRARVARYAAAPDRARITAFLAHLLKIPTPGEDGVQMRAARRDPKLMGDQVRRACRDLLDAETHDHPVLFIIEDINWGDRATIEILGRALRDLAARPLMLLATSRPGLGDILETMWPECTEIVLGPLKRSATAEFVRSALGGDIAEGRVTALLDRAQGNAFYLEELVRNAARGQWDLPETVTAMVHARLGALDPHARRVLRAASVFGKQFWHGGVAALLSDDVAVDSWLDELVMAELISLAPTARFARQAEYQFHHAMLRDIAYGTLTDQDRALGHRLAARWLERVGEGDARVIAEHYFQGDDRPSALGFFLRAAEDALDRSDFDAAV
ncbi:MAG: protein kinase, partial [Myxococcota bacterium]